MVCGYPIGTTLDAMRYHHVRHHRDSGMPTDPYFKAGVEESRVLYVAQMARGLLLLPFWMVRGPFGLAAWAVPGLRGVYGRAFLQDRSGEDLTRSVEVARCAREELGQVIFHTLVWAAWWRWPWAVGFGNLLPAWGAGVLAAWRLLQEHVYEGTTERGMETIFRATRDHHTGAVGQIVLAPLNIGYHVVHHLHPQVGLRHLPALTVRGTNAPIRVGIREAYELCLHRRRVHPARGDTC